MSCPGTVQQALPKIAGTWGHQQLSGKKSEGTSFPFRGGWTHSILIGNFHPAGATMGCFLVRGGGSQTFPVWRVVIAFCSAIALGFRVLSSSFLLHGVVIWVGLGRAVLKEELQGPSLRVPRRPGRCSVSHMCHPFTASAEFSL